MTEGRFERDLRAAIRRLAPDEVPVDLRARLASVTAETPSRLPSLVRGWWVAGGLAAGAIVVVTVIGVLVAPQVSRTAASSIVGDFVYQTDGEFGYEMLRPAGWTGRDMSGQGRAYLDGQTTAASHVVLSVNNLAVVTHPDPSEGLDLDWELFRDAASLDGWTAALERLWRNDRQPFTLVQTLPNAKIYSTSYPDGSQFGLVAYVVDAGQPLIVGLDGVGDASLEPVDKLRADGLLDDFATMVKSVRAIPADPANVSPPL